MVVLYRRLTLLRLLMRPRMMLFMGRFGMLRVVSLLRSVFSRLRIGLLSRLWVMRLWRTRLATVVWMVVT